MGYRGQVSFVALGSVLVMAFMQGCAKKAGNFGSASVIPGSSSSGLISVLATRNFPGSVGLGLVDPVGQCGGFFISIQGSHGAFSASLSASGNVRFYSDAACSVSISQVNFSSSDNYQAVFVKDAVAEMDSVSVYTAKYGSASFDADFVSAAAPSPSPSPSPSKSMTPPPCVPIECPAPPRGCKYVNPVIQNGCPISCGTLSCPMPSPSPSPTVTDSSCTNVMAKWQGIAESGTQSGDFSVAFDAIPGQSDMDGIIGVSQDSPSQYSDIAADVRFNSSGDIDSVSGSDYQASSTIPYSAGQKYHFEMDVNVANSTYSAYVTPPNSARKIIGMDMPFRSDQSGVSSIGDVGLYAEAQSYEICNLVVSPMGASPSPSCTPVDCAAPPAGCQYMNPIFKNGCQVSCGTLSCVAPPTPTPSPSKTVTPTPSPSPSKTVKPSPSPSPSPSPTKTVTPTPSPSPSPVQFSGKNIYIAQNAAGAANGSSCANAHAMSFFNSSSNWGSGANQISPGTTVHLCGTISMPANQEALVFQGSGTAGNPITLYFESGAMLKSPEWPPQGSGGAIDVSNQNYIVIDGNGGAGGAVRGVIEATATGDSGAACLSGKCTYHNDSNGIEADSSNNLTVKGLSIIDMYVAVKGVPDGGGGACMWGHGRSSNWLITNNIFHDMSWCINLQYDSGTSSGITISNNQIYNIDHGIAIGGPHPGNTLQNVNVYGNNIHDYSNWDTGAADVWHHDGIHIWGDNNDGSDTINGVNIYDNKFGGCIGQNVTAHIFIETNSGGTKNVKIYNNTLIDTCNGQDGDGLLTASDPGYQVYNNTFIGTAGDTCVGLSGSANSVFINNVVSGCGRMQYITTGGGFAAGSLHNNVYANCQSDNCFVYRGDYTASFSTWQSDTGQDANSVYVSNANLSAAGVPQTGSPAIGAGANLSNLNIPALDSSLDGSPRPSSGAWDEGAYKAGASIGVSQQLLSDITKVVARCSRGGGGGNRHSW